MVETGSSIPSLFICLAGLHFLTLYSVLSFSIVFLFVEAEPAFS